MTNTIEIFVDTKGEATVTTNGFAGSSCRDASKFIEQALGQRVSEPVTAEFHQTASTGQVIRQQG